MSEQLKLQLSGILTAKKDAQNGGFPELHSVNALVCQALGERPLKAPLAELLDLEACQLRPALHQQLLQQRQAAQAHHQFSKTLAAALAALEAHIGKLPQHQKQQQQAQAFLFSADKPGAADVILWSDLYPVLNSPHSAAEAAIPRLLAWFQGVRERRPDFAKAAAAVAASGGFEEEARHPGVSVNPNPEPCYGHLQDPAPLAAGAPVTGEQPKQRQQQQQQQSQKQRQLAPEDAEAADDLPYPEATAEELAQCRDAFFSGSGVAQQPLPSASGPRLPVKGQRNLLVTSALPYVNNVPHLGNIIGCVLSADVYVRFHRQRGANVLYICGTDEYGTATETKALAEGVTPQAICDKYHKIHAEIYSWFGIEFDHFGRTTTEQQTSIAQDIFWRLQKAGHIIKDSVSQLYCGKCDKFLADRFVEGTCPLCRYTDCRGDQCDKCGRLINAVELVSPRCKVCSETPVIRSSEHLFLDLPNLQPLLLSHLDSVMDAADSQWTENAKQITRSWIKTGLQPRCISRDLKWGTPVPLEGYTDKVFYVWYDAPIGYISITAAYTKDWEQWWKQPDAVDLIQFMAKDNVPFHSVIFPACCLAAHDNYACIKHLVATEYLNYEDTKFSKSRGIGVFGTDVQATGIEADVWRFYLVYVRPEGQDSSFSWDDLMLKNNSELLNNLGNFINRPLQFLKKYFNSTLPDVQLTQEDLRFLHAINHELGGYIESLEKARLRDGLRRVLNISRYGNQYMQLNRPWAQLADPAAKPRAASVVALAANVASLLGTLLHPYMPAVAARVAAQCGLQPGLHPIQRPLVRPLPPGHRIGEPVPLFAKMLQENVQLLRARFGSSSGGS